MVSSNNKYFIDINGLKEGIHYYNFPIDSNFFKQYILTENFEGKGVTNIILKRDLQEINIEMRVVATIDTKCDICLEKMKYGIKGRNHFYVKFGQAKTDNNSNIIWLSDNEHKILIADKIYETITVNLPICFSHKEKNEKCNPKMLKLIDNYSYKKSEIDPRWDELRKLIVNK